MSDVCRAVFRGRALALQVLDRDGVRACSHQEPYAVLSITDPQYRHPALKRDDSRQAVLQIAFSDVGERAARLKTTSPHITAFTPEFAAQVADFVSEQVRGGTGLLVINCEAGMSRSAGIAAAVSQFYNDDEMFYFAHYRPNEWVRNLVLEALRSKADAPKFE